MVDLLVLLSSKIQVECDKQASQVVDQFVIKRQFKEKVWKVSFCKKMWCHIIGKVKCKHLVSGMFTTVKFLDKCHNFITIYNLQFKSVQNSQTFKGSSANMER